MTTPLLALGLAYLFLLSLLGLALVRSELGTGPKFVLLLTCFLFYLWHYHALQDYPGWPASDRLPDHFEVISSVTVEPDLQRGEAGAIYVWVRDLDAERPVPRAYRFEYQKKLHRQVEDALDRQARGERMLGMPTAGGSSVRPRIEFLPMPRDHRLRKNGG